MPKIFNYIIFNRRAIKGKFLPLKFTFFCMRFPLLNTTPLSSQQPLAMTSCQKQKWIFECHLIIYPGHKSQRAKWPSSVPQRIDFGKVLEKKEKPYICPVLFRGSIQLRVKKDYCWPPTHNCATIIPLISPAIQI